MLTGWDSHRQYHFRVRAVLATVGNDTWSAYRDTIGPWSTM